MNTICKPLALIFEEKWILELKCDKRKCKVACPSLYDILSRRNCIAMHYNGRRCCSCKLGDFLEIELIEHDVSNLKVAMELCKNIRIRETITLRDYDKLIGVDDV